MIISVSLDEEDVRLIDQITKQFYDRTHFPENNYFERCSDEDIWEAIVSQIIVIGRAEPDEKIDKEKLSLTKLGSLKKNQEHILSYVNDILALAGVRYVSTKKISKKAIWIVDNLSNPSIIRNGRVVLLEEMEHFLAEHELNNRREKELKAREFIRSKVKGFGLKAASDFLIQLGYAQTLIPFDVRELEFINKVLKPNIALSPGELGTLIYHVLEESFQVLTERVGIFPSRFDRIVFQNKKEIIKNFGNS